MMKTDAIGLYLHIPFCLKKCNYCDFCSFSNLSEDEKNSYIKVLINEIKTYKKEDDPIAIDSIFFGGGTPSLLSETEFANICRAIKETFVLDTETEFTVEANPKTLTCEKLVNMKNCGVNRLSIGMQTIHENESKILGRIHNYDDFLAAFNLARECGIDNVGVDIMYGIPLQTKDSFEKTLNTILSLSPEHISAYGLILEEGTPFWDKRFDLKFPDENEEIEMYFLASDLLKKHGYTHYEISNYAKPGRESKHNLKYWQNREYIGVGISAYSYFQGVRYGNTKNLTEYLSSDTPAPVSTEIIDRQGYATEYLMLGLRLKSGISIERYEKLSGVNILKSNSALIAKYLTDGYISIDGDNFSLTEKGFYVSNTIISSLL